MNAVLRLYDLATPFARVADLGRPLLLLALRLFIASVFFKAGLTKIEDWDTTLFLFTEEYSVPLLPPALAAFSVRPANCCCRRCSPSAWPVVSPRSD